MDMLGFLLTAFIAAMAIATASVTLTRARMFEPVRAWWQPKNYLVFKLISCPYCMSHWLALWVAPFIIYQVTEIWAIDFLATWFFLTGSAALLEGLMMNGLHMQENLIHELEGDNLTLKQQVIALEKQIGFENDERDQWIKEGMRQERERFGFMDLKLRQPIN